MAIKVEKVREIGKLPCEFLGGSLSEAITQYFLSQDVDDRMGRRKNVRDDGSEKRDPHHAEAVYVLPGECPGCSQGVSGNPRQLHIDNNKITACIPTRRSSRFVELGVKNL